MDRALAVDLTLRTCHAQPIGNSPIGIWQRRLHWHDTFCASLQCSASGAADTVWLAHHVQRARRAGPGAVPGGRPP